MTTKQFKAARLKLGENQVQMAKILGVRWNTFWRWEAGQRAIPAWVGRYLTLYRTLLKHLSKDEIKVLVGLS